MPNYRCTLPPTALGYSPLRRSILAPAALGPLRLQLSSSEFPDGAGHPFAAAYKNSARIASLWAGAALANRPVTIRRV